MVGRFLALPVRLAHVRSFFRHFSVPNTFCHIAVQLPASRLLWPGADYRLILIGCVIPDLPWIVKRLGAVMPFVDSYHLQLYAVAQASLFICCLLTLAIALCTARFLFNFTLIAANCLAHLLLDASQIKWANGVHLFAPFSWRLLHLDLSWPEHPLWLALSAAGLAVLLVTWWQNRRRPWPSLYAGKNRRTRFTLAALCLLLYFVAPLAFTQQIEREDNDFLATVHEQSARPGKYAEFDRRPYQDGFLTLYDGEKIKLIGGLPHGAGLVSVRGRFISPDTLSVIELRPQSQLRDWASILALTLIALIFLHSLLEPNRARRRQSFLTTETMV